MKLLFVLAILLLGSSSYANFTGVWQGDAIVTLKDGRTGYCDEIILIVNNHAADKIEFGKFRYACGEFAINFQPPVLTLGKKKMSGQDAFLKEEKIGKISSTKANLLFPLANNGKGRYTVKKVSENEVDYLDEQIGVNAETGKEEITSIKAKLFKVK